MQYLWTTITVNDMDESIAFYTDLLGLGVIERVSASPSIELGFRGNGTENETLIELLADSEGGPARFHECISIGFAVDSLDTMLETLGQKNITVHKGPIETPAARFFFIKDPNGLTIQFFEHL